MDSITGSSPLLSLLAITGNVETAWQLAFSDACSFFARQSMLASECVGVALGVPHRAACENVQLAAEKFLGELTSNPNDVSFAPRDLRQCLSP